MTKFLIPALIVLLTGCEPRLHRAVKSRDYDQVVQYLNAGDNIDINSTTEISDFFSLIITFVGNRVPSAKIKSLSCIAFIADGFPPTPVLPKYRLLSSVNISEQDQVATTGTDSLFINLYKLSVCSDIRTPPPAIINGLDEFSNSFNILLIDIKNFAVRSSFLGGIKLRAVCGFIIDL